MPIYKYKCKGCGHEFEELVRAGEKVQCPKCRCIDLNRLISGFNVPGKGGSGGGADVCSTGTCPFCK